MGFGDVLQERSLRILLVAGAALVVTWTCACRGSRIAQSPSVNSNVRERKIANANSCSLLSETEIASAVGNDVDKGRNEASTDICKWDAEDVSQVDVLLIVREKGGIHEPVLCSDLRNKTNSGDHIPGLGDIAGWKFSRQGSMFNSGDLEVCGPKGYLSITLEGKRDEASLKAAAMNLTQKILQRL